MIWTICPNQFLSQKKNNLCMEKLSNDGQWDIEFDEDYGAWCGIVNIGDETFSSYNLQDVYTVYAAPSLLLYTQFEEDYLNMDAESFYKKYYNDFKDLFSNHVITGDELYNNVRNVLRTNALTKAKGEK